MTSVPIGHTAKEGDKEMTRGGLTPAEYEEFCRLWLKASSEACRQGVMLVHPEITGHPLPPILNALRDGTWRKKLSDD